MFNATAGKASSIANTALSRLKADKLGVVKRGLVGAGIGGAIGGGINYARGEDFWDGAGRGIVGGGMAGGAWGVANTAAGGNLGKRIAGYDYADLADRASTSTRGHVKKATDTLKRESAKAKDVVVNPIDKFNAARRGKDNVTRGPNFVMYH